MMQVLVLAGMAWFLMRDPNKPEDENGGSDWVDPNRNADGSCKDGYAENSEGVCVPFEVILPYVDITRWSGEYTASGSGGDQVVWSYETGVRYEDGSEEYDAPQWVIGNADHSAFLSASVGGITIGDSTNVRTFPDLATASAKADELANPSETSPTGLPLGRGVESEETVEEFVAEQDTFVEGGYVDFGKGVDSLGQNSGGEYRMYDM